MNFLKLAEQRSSIRSYTSVLPEKEKLDYVIEAARLAPSAVNFQPWIFVLVTKKEGMEKLYNCYPREWFKTAPMAIIACLDHGTSWKRSSDGKDHGDIDVAIATEHICLAAAEQGLGTCWVCNFDTDKCKANFNIPAAIEPIAIITIGYPADEANEKTDKKRKPYSEIIRNEQF